MEFFTKTMAVKLRSHLDKYLVADDDRENIRQGRRSGSSIAAKWLVETVEGKDHVIRLKSCHGGYLTASDVPFLLGMTGKKVMQAVPGDVHCSGDWMLEWEPIRDGFQVRLRSWCGKYLRANGGTPPWRNSLTHDDPHTGATQKWILWDVEGVEISESEQTVQEYLSSMSSFSTVADDVLSVLGSEDGGSPRKTNTVLSKSSSMLSSDRDQTSGMDFFRRAKVVRLRNHHNKYLVADDDEVSITQERKGSSLNARWTVEFVLNSDYIIRLKSCYGNYLTASNQPFLMGMTGRKVLQTLPRRLDSSVEWEPIREGSRLRLRTRYGNFLRANGGLPPWRNSVTHDIPQRTATQDWILWEVDVLQILEQSDGDFEPLVESVARVDSVGSESTSREFGSSSDNSGSLYSQELQVRESFEASTPPTMSDGRIIYYHIADENGYVEGEDMEGFCLNFKGNTVEELTCILEEETGMRSIVVCSRSPLNGHLVPLRLRLPPNIIMHVIVAPSSTAAGVATATSFRDESNL